MTGTKDTTKDLLLLYNNILFTVQTRDEQEETNQKQSKVNLVQTVNTATRSVCRTKRDGWNVGVQSSVTQKQPWPA